MKLNNNTYSPNFKQTIEFVDKQKYHELKKALSPREVGGFYTIGDAVSGVKASFTEDVRDCSSVTVTNPKSEKHYKNHLQPSANLPKIDSVIKRLQLSIKALRGTFSENLEALMIGGKIFPPATQNIKDWTKKSRELSSQLANSMLKDPKLDFTMFGMQNYKFACESYILTDSVKNHHYVYSGNSNFVVDSAESLMLAFEKIVLGKKAKVVINGEDVTSKLKGLLK